MSDTITNRRGHFAHVVNFHRDDHVILLKYVCPCKQDDCDHPFIEDELDHWESEDPEWDIIQRFDLRFDDLEPMARELLRITAFKTVRRHLKGAEANFPPPVFCDPIEHL